MEAINHLISDTHKDLSIERGAKLIVPDQDWDLSSKKSQDDDTVKP